MAKLLKYQTGPYTNNKAIRVIHAIRAHAFFRNIPIHEILPIRPTNRKIKEQITQRNSMLTISMSTFSNASVEWTAHTIAKTNFSALYNPHIPNKISNIQRIRKMAKKMGIIIL